MLVLLSIFAAASVLLASVAVYSLLAQSVAERTREIGVRLALGAARRDVMQLMLASGVAPAAVGLAVGLAASIATGRALGTLLFDVRPADPLVLATAVALVGAVAVTACVVPTLRALRVDPATTLRQE
jgi:ABC-type antimicrobial peptide transport system permease subunit